MIDPFEDYYDEDIPKQQLPESKANAVSEVKAKTRKPRKPRQTLPKTVQEAVPTVVEPAVKTKKPRRKAENKVAEVTPVNPLTPASSPALPSVTPKLRRESEWNKLTKVYGIPKKGTKAYDELMKEYHKLQKK
jgi:hypothetical protein